jgi:hypothetical protein
LQIALPEVWESAACCVDEDLLALIFHLFNVSKDLNQVMPKTQQTSHSEKDDCKGNVTSNPIVLLGLRNFSLSDLLANCGASGCAQAKSKHKHEGDYVHEDNLGRLLLDAEVASHEGHDLVGPPLETEHHGRRNSKGQVLANANEGLAVWHRDGL